MKYKATKTISLTMVLILLLGAFAGCSNALNGDKETTPSLNAGVQPDNLGGSNNNDSEINSETKEAKWREAEMAMKSEYVSLGFKEENLSVVRIADFREVYVGMVRTGEIYEESYETIGGFDFVYNPRRSTKYKDAQPMDVYYRGECYKLADAFENGILESKDLFELFKSCRDKDKADISWSEHYDGDWFILIYVTPSHNYRTYTLNDFMDLGCMTISDWRPKDVEEGLVSRAILLKFSKDKSENMFEIIEEIERRSDVWSIKVSNSGFEYAD